MVIDIHRRSREGGHTVALVDWSRAVQLGATHGCLGWLSMEALGGTHGVTLTGESLTGVVWLCIHGGNEIYGSYKWKPSTENNHQTKKKKRIENCRKPQFGFKIWEQYKYNFWEQKQKTMTKHTLYLIASHPIKPCIEIASWNQINLHQGTSRI